MDGAASVDELVDAAAQAWQTALGQSQPIDIQLVVRDFGTLQLGEAQILEVAEPGVPVRGRITVDDDANGIGWYGSVEEPVAAGKYDLYTVLLHEIGHTLGFTQSYAGFANYVESGPDGEKVFAGPNFTVELDATGQHLDPVGSPDDLMNPELNPGVRKLPSTTDVQILQASYQAAETGQHGFSPDAASFHVHVESLVVDSYPFAHQDVLSRELQLDVEPEPFAFSPSVPTLLTGSDACFELYCPSRTDTSEPANHPGNLTDAILAEIQNDAPVLTTPAEGQGWLPTDVLASPDVLREKDAFGELLDEWLKRFDTELEGIEIRDAAFAQWH